MSAKTKRYGFFPLKGWCCWGGALTWQLSAINHVPSGSIGRRSEVAFIMSPTAPLDPYEAALADLKAKRAEIDAAITVIERVRAMGGSPTATPALASISSEASVVVPTIPNAVSIAEDGPFYGLGLREAVAKQLSIVSPREPQSAQQLWTALEAGGFVSAHNNPVGAVHTALRRRAKTHGDVFVVRDGKWGRPDWYTEKELEEIDKSVGGMGGRDRSTHSARTKAGMLVAKRRGVRLGAALIMTPQRVAEAEQMLASGSSVSEVATKFGVSRQTLYVRYDREKIRELRMRRASETENQAEPAKAEANGAAGTRH